MRLILWMILLSLIISCTNQSNSPEALSPMEEQQVLAMAKSYFQVLTPFDWESLTESQKVRISLGRDLFYNKRLSQNQNQNCASCHKMDQFAQDNLRVSPGDAGQTGVRNVPSILNAAHQYALFWDARSEDLAAQAAGPIFGQKEMGMKDTLELIARIEADTSYQSLFLSGFPGTEGPVISLEKITLALAAFEETLISPGRFDAFLQGTQNALSPLEKRGLRSFIEQGCIPCHSGKLLGGQMAQKFALFGYYWDYTESQHLDKGLYGHTMKPGDKFFFKVPPLRNVAKTGPYFHDGSVEELKDCIRIMGLAELNIEINDSTVTEIEAFLHALTGEVPTHALENEPLPFE